MILNPTARQVIEAIYDTLHAESNEIKGPTGLLADVKDGAWYLNHINSVQRLEPFFMIEQTSKKVMPKTCSPGGQDWHEYTFTAVFGNWGEESSAQREQCYKLSQTAQDILRPNDCGVFFMPLDIEEADIMPFKNDAGDMVWFAGFTIKGTVKYYRPR